MDFRECIRKRLLIKARPDREKALIALQTARERLLDAEISFEAEVFSGTVILSYTAMFYAARALLFKVGFREKSHICVKEFLRERFVKTGRLDPKFLSTLNNARIERHEALYGLESKASKQEAEHTLSQAREFLKKTQKLLKEKQSTPRNH